MAAMVPIAALLLAAASPADDAMAAWMQCLADQAEVMARSSETADVAADAAMGACTAAEGHLTDLERRGVSDRGLRGLERAQRDGRAVVRQKVIARVVEIRGRSSRF